MQELLKQVQKIFPEAIYEKQLNSIIFIAKDENCFIHELDARFKFYIAGKCRRKSKDFQKILVALKAIKK